MPKKTFEQWMNEVNVALVKRCGTDSRDLPDCPYHDWYSAGKTPKGAASAAYKAANEG